MRKLIPNLYDKTNYGIHYQTLRCCLKYGLKLKKIHYAVEFVEEPWLRSYIELNTRLRVKHSDSKFGKEFFKYANNAVFGKDYGEREE